ncbi:MAG: peptidoglycan DD-metalloendopeptidase family protein [Gammaproteobacteria bacterium]|nr:peptidoglycan DD-metalloendopeptidase family protein [Gammaproteobacteria bacterium]
MRVSDKTPRQGIPFVYAIAALLAVALITGSVFNTLSSRTLLNDNRSPEAEVPFPPPPESPVMPFQDEGVPAIPPEPPRPETLLEKPAGPVVAGQPLQHETDTTIVVKKGDTLSGIFNRLGLYPELSRILELGEEVRELETIYPGQKLHLALDGDRITYLDFESSKTRSLRLYRTESSFAAEKLNRKPARYLHAAAGIISSSLYRAGRSAGLSDAMIMSLVRIFGWDIDFTRHIQEGDSFTVVYEKLYLDEEEVGTGDIIAAEFVNAGKTYRAYRYTDLSRQTDYYSPDGKSMRKSFLRAPVSLAHVSSHFSLRRRHPILNVFRAHKGVDYAAATGTPVMASGTGRVIFRGTRGQYGKTIILKHGDLYTTLYAHMSRYARDTGVGSRVKQGQTIGYVGRTGLATGPHLHYEFRINGVHHDPLKVRLPGTRSLPDSELEHFRMGIQPLVAQLDENTPHRLAMQENRESTYSH